MSATITGASILLGTNPAWIGLKVTNAPADAIKIRTRFRQGEFAAAFVRRPSGIEEWTLALTDDGLLLHSQRRSKQSPVFERKKTLSISVTHSRKIELP